MPQMAAAGETLVSGARQTLLTHESQLIVGCYITGIAFSKVWRVVGRDATHVGLQAIEAGDVVCDQAGRTHDIIPPASHTSHPNTFERCRVCGWGREVITSLLPLPGAPPRTMVLTPLDAVRPTRPYTIYAVPQIQAGVSTYTFMYRNDVPNIPSPLPIIPQLAEVWRLPDALAALIQEEESPADRQDG